MKIIRIKYWNKMILQAPNLSGDSFGAGVRADSFKAVLRVFYQSVVKYIR